MTLIGLVTLGSGFFVYKTQQAARLRHERRNGGELHVPPGVRSGGGV